MSSTVDLAQATFTSSLGGNIELTQYSDGTCAIRVKEGTTTAPESFIVLTNALARCIASTLSEMAGD